MTEEGRLRRKHIQEASQYFSLTEQELSEWRELDEEQKEISNG